MRPLTSAASVLFALWCQGGGGGSPGGLPSERREASRFDEGYALGRPDPNELADALDVPEHFRRLVALECGAEAEGDTPLRNLGDALAWLRPTGELVSVEERLAELARRAPALAVEIGWILPELLHEESYRSAGWKGRKDYADDGFLSLEGWWPWYRFYREHWSELDATSKPKAYQVVTLVFQAVPDDARPRDAAEALARVCRAAHSFADHDSWRGLSAHPKDVAFVPDSTWVAPAGDALSYALRCEFSGSWPPTFELDVRERMQAGALVTESYCADGAWDFFAGRQEFVPVHDSRGGFVCLLALGTYAALEVHGDILLRESLGNLKELAERAPR